jgi:hypothetical protein
VANLGRFPFNIVTSEVVDAARESVVIGIM